MNNITESSSSIDINKKNAEHGFFNSPLYEPSNQVVFNNSLAEKVIYGENNTYIVLGRDRPSSLTSGYGGLGHSKAGAIDIVVGRVSAVNGNEIKESKVNPSFSADAARIYLSQKSNIDEYFQIGSNPLKNGSKALSAIGIKADDIRIIARNSLKIVTRTDPLLSNKNVPYDTMGIQLIANNDEESLQPIVLGKNLETALKSLHDRLQDIVSHIKNYVIIQNKFNEQISDHTHFSPFYAQKTSIDPKVMMEAKKAAIKTFTNVEDQLMKDCNNLTSWLSTYLVNNKNNYINSKYNFSN
jgi:hypothetical protein